MKKNKVLVIGSGGREHAIIWKLAKSRKVGRIFCAPGNGGISGIAQNVPIKATDVSGIVEFCRREKPNLVVVTPDDPLMLGMSDALEEAGFRAFGPKKAAALIEGSKSFAKELMNKYNIPTAKYQVFDKSEEAIAYINKIDAPIVVKADGLALGKGVTVAQTKKEAIAAVHLAMDDKAFGSAGARVVIEECLFGPEVSVLTFTDGQTILTMPSAQDHKRAYDGDLGQNTGGMGAFTPSKYYTKEIEEYCEKNIFYPTINAMKAEGREFRGVLYFGLILTKDGPKVIEYNARFGDPETQAVLMRLRSDLYEIMNAVIDGKLSQTEIKWYKSAACCVVLTSGGYPGKYETGYQISGLDQAADLAKIFHAGTECTNGIYKTTGGRVLGVTAAGRTLDGAIKRAYDAAGKISFYNMHLRRDIGKK